MNVIFAAFLRGPTSSMENTVLGAAFVGGKSWRESRQRGVGFVAKYAPTLAP
jgi:hypothetical protein